MVYRETFFANPVASFPAPHPQELNPWSSRTEEPLHSSTVEKSERQTQDQDQRCKSWPSAKNSVIFSGGDSSKNCGADQQRLQISDLHFDKFPTPATFACWKIRFKTEGYVLVHNFLRKLCNGSKKWSWLIQWRNWDLRDLLVVFQCRILKYSMRGLLQHWTKSSIILTSKEESLWRNKRPRSRTVSFVEGRSITWSMSTSGSQEPTIQLRILPTYSHLVFEIMIFRNSIWNGTEFCCLWRTSHLMTSWKDCTKWEYESRRSSRPYGNCMTLRFIIRKIGPD